MSHSTFRLACLVSLITCFFAGRILAADLVISEVMAHPLKTGAQAAANEYIEICNIGSTSVDLGNCLIATPGGARQRLIPWDGLPSGIPPGRMLAPGGIALVTSPGYTRPHQAWFSSVPHPAGRIHLTIEGSRLGVYGLPDSGGAIFLEDTSGKLLDVFVWHEDAGEDRSWERSNPANNTDALQRSQHGGTPGSAALRDTAAATRRECLILRQPDRRTPALAILTLAQGEEARLSLHTLDGRTVRRILEQARGPGVWRIPVFCHLDDGRQMPAGRFLVSATITTSTGGQTHVSRILRLAPNRR